MVGFLRLRLRWLVAGACLVLLTLVQAAPQRARGDHRPGAAAIEGVTLRVVDGDSLWFTPTGKPAIEVRLADIDAPELCQPHGREARRALAELVLHKPGRLRVLARDAYGRLVARLDLAGVDVATRMVEEGQAWSSRHRHDRGPLVKQERMARALARGLHAASGAVMPSDFRRSHGPCPGAAAPAPKRAAVSPNAAPVGR